MRARKTSQGFTLRAIAGTHVVLLGMHLDKALCTGLMGFAIHRTDHTEDEAFWLEGMKTFEETDPGFPENGRYGTHRHPIQGFTWSDFSAKPGRRYTYRVVALKGVPKELTKFRQVEVTVKTEAEAAGNHDVFFNRGAAASQEYSRRFGKLASLKSAPDDDPRWAWLSRGAAEGLLAFVARATGAGHGLRVAAYEFRLPMFAQALRAAVARGVDVRILYDGNNNPPEEDGLVFPRDENRATALAAQVDGVSSERITRNDVKSSPIAHHKFVVHTVAGKAQAVLTGSTNFSKGGVYGQSNVVHVVESKPVAAKYLACWELIAGNPAPAVLKAALAQLGAIPATPLPKDGTSCLFSPQPTDDALDWYAALAKATPGALFMTFAFGMNALFKDAYQDGAAPLRYALMDKLIPSGTRKDKREAAIAEMTTLRKQVANRFAVGNRIETNAFDRWLREKLTGLNSHVQFIHTKYMLVDPLSDDPVVITGSANFSKASSDENDENMLLIRGNTRVADIYLGEYMRLWNHYAFREWLSERGADAPVSFKHLDTTSTWWKGYFGSSARSRQRAYFAGVDG